MADADTDPTGPPEAFDLRHHGDSDAIATTIADWLSGVLGAGSEPRVTVAADGIANGMSSSTVLFDLDWNDHGTARHDELVARVAPDVDDVAVFPTYDLAGQYETMRLVADAGGVPMPPLRWRDDAGEVLGRPFFVMDRVAGRVPPDMLPYTFGDNWLFDATPAERAGLEAAMIDTLARLHAIGPATERFGFLAGDPGVDGGDDSPRGHLARHLARTQAWYDWSVGDSGTRSTLVETALAQLTANLPTDVTTTVLSWGDARIGNVLFDGFTPRAVLDWEMADLGPRELDVVWLAYSHRVFQDLAEGLDAPGLPDFLTIDGVVAAYEAATGHSVADLEWHLKYAAVRWACAFLRTGARQAHLDGTTLTDDGDSLLHNRPSLTALVEGTFTR